MILASRSPRRKELLRQCGVEFSVFASDVGELNSGSGVAVEALPAANAALKAAAVSELFPDEPVLGADTMVICDGRAFGKPADENESFRMLKALSGKSHQVITGVALYWKERHISEVWSETSWVHFKTLTDDTIWQYIRQVNTLDKAGAYAIQEYGELIISHVDGEIENVIGLPLANLKQRLQNL